MIYIKDKLGLSWAKLSNCWGWDLDKLELLHFRKNYLAKKRLNSIHEYQG